MAIYWRCLRMVLFKKPILRSSIIEHALKDLEIEDAIPPLN